MCDPTVGCWLPQEEAHRHCVGEAERWNNKA
jgi:hypothetical protein